MNMISHLQEIYDFYVVTRDTDYISDQPYEGVKSNEWNDGPYGEKVFYCSNDNLKRKFIKKITQSTEYDILYINGVYSYYFSILPLYYFKKRRDRKVIIATRGMFAQSAIKVKALRKKTFIAAAKILGLYRKVIFHATSAHEVEDIRRVNGKHSNIVIAENFPVKSEMISARVSRKNEHELKLISVARISPEKNQEFAIKTLQGITSGIVQFDLFGPVYNEEYKLKCDHSASKLTDNITINFKGSIHPDELKKIFRKYDFLYLPTQGENFGHTILESLMAGTPLLISDQTPWNDSQDHGAGFVLPLDEEKFRQKIVRLISMNREEHQKMINNSLTYISKKTNTSPLMERYLNLFG